MLTKKERRKKVAEWLGRKPGIEKAFIKRQDDLSRKNSKEYEECVKNMGKICHTTIKTLPISVWWEVLDTGNVMGLLKQEYQPTHMEYNAMRYIFILMEDEKLKMFGLPEKQRKIIELEQDLVELIRERVDYDDFSQQTFIDILMDRIAEMKADTNTEKVMLEHITIQLERILKMPIDTEKCTVAKFYNYIKIVEQNG